MFEDRPRAAAHEEAANVAQRRYRRYAPNAPERRPKTSSRAAARAWLRERPNQQAIRVQLEALGVAIRLKRDLVAFGELSTAQTRFLRQLERARKQDPELALRFVKDTRKAVLAVHRLKFTLRAFRSMPESIAVQNRFGFVAAAVLEKAKAMKIEGLAPLLMCCASRVAGLQDPRPTEAAAMGVAAGLDPATKSRVDQEKLEANWVKRLRLVRRRVETAMAAGEKLLTEIGVPD